MINLLPDGNKSEIRAARLNVILVRYIVILICATGVLGALVAGSYVVLNGTKSSAEQKVAENEKRVSQYQSIKNDSDTFRSELATAKTILDDSITYSKLIYKIANIVPRNVVLDDLTLNPSTFGSSIVLSASAKTFGDATKLQDSFKNNNQIFSEVNLQSIKSSESSSEDYPVKVSLSVIINKGALQ